jgi:putative transposase
VSYRRVARSHALQRRLGSAQEARNTAWERCGVWLHSRDQADALPDVKQACPAYHAVPSQVLQAVLKRRDRVFDAFFRRLKAGEQPGAARG